MKARDPKQAPCLKLTAGDRSKAKSGADQEQIGSRRSKKRAGRSRREQKRAKGEHERS